MLAPFCRSQSSSATHWSPTFVSLGLMIFAGQFSALLPVPHRNAFIAGVFGFTLTAKVQAWTWAGLAYDPSGLSEGAAQLPCWDLVRTKLLHPG